MAPFGMHSSVFISKLPTSIHRFSNSLSSFSAVPCSHIPTSHPCQGISQVGVGLYPLWSGLKRTSISIRHRCGKNRQKRKRKGRAVYSSLFGVGAPEALVIGVVALLVFGPRGLAEEVSEEFKTTLKREIGIDEARPSATDSFKSKQPYVDENSQAQLERTDSIPPTKTAYSSEELLKITEEQLKAAAAKQQFIPEEQAAATPDFAAKETLSDNQEK